MGKTVLGNSGPQFNWTGAGATAWVPFHFAAIQQVAASEADLQHRMGHAGVFGDLTAESQTFTRSSASHVKLRINGADALDLPVNATGAFSDYITTAAVVVDDLVSMVYENGSGSGNWTLAGAACTFEASGGKLVSIFGAIGSGNFSAGLLALNGNGITRWVSPIVGFGNQGNGLHDGETEIPTVGGTISYFQMNVQSNTRTGDVTVTLNKNGVATALTFTIPAGGTGKFGDFTHSVAFAAGDVFNIQLTMAPSTGVANVVCGSFEVEWDSTSQFVVVCANKINGFDAWGNDSYVSAIGGGMADSTTIAQRQTVWPIMADLVEFICYSDTTSGDITTTLNVNGSDSAMTVTRPGGAGGSNRLSITTTVSVNPSDLLCYHHVRAGSTTNGFGAAYLVVEIAPTGLAVAPDQGDLEIEGLTATIEVITPPLDRTPATGTLEVEGLTPRREIPYRFDAGEPGTLEIEGLEPIVNTATYSVYPGTQTLEIEGYAPALIENKNLGQLPVLALTDGEVKPAASNLPVLIAAEIVPDGAMSQVAVLELAEVVPPVATSQLAVLFLVGDAPCLTRRCQLWRITRTDGEVFRYTSIDRDFLWGTETFKACASLNASASESEASLESVGNIELEGLIDDDGISEADLYSGKFDDAYVEVWLVPWDNPADYTRRLAAGWTGSLSMGDQSFQMEVLGPSSKLKQEGLIETFAATCRFDFGDERCAVDVAALETTGDVEASNTRADFIANLASEDTSLQYENGKVIWTTGPNAGQTCEVKTVDLGTGLITLWTPAWFVPQAGDTFTLQPGCDHTRDGGCTVYNNRVRFGGFRLVPGNDSLLESPLAKY